MSQSKPRLRSSIEGGNFYPRGPSVGLSPNISSGAYAQKNLQNNCFFLASDVVSGSLGPFNCLAGNNTVFSSGVVPFPNIPVAQGITPTTMSPFKTKQSTPIAPTGATTLLFRVHQGNLQLTQGLIVASVQLEGNVVDSNGITIQGPYLAPGGNYRQFGAMFAVTVYNPTGAAVLGTLRYSINGDLSAGYPSG